MVRSILADGLGGEAHLFGDALAAGYLCKVYRRSLAETYVHRSSRPGDEQVSVQPSGLSATLAYAL